MVGFVEPEGQPANEILHKHPFDLLPGPRPSLRGLLPANAGTDRAGRGAGVRVFHVQRAPLPGLWRPHRQPGGDAGSGRGPDVQNPFGSLYRHSERAAPPAGGRGLRHGGCRIRRTAGVRHRAGQHGAGTTVFSRRRKQKDARGIRRPTTSSSRHGPTTASATRGSSGSSRRSRCTRVPVQQPLPLMWVAGTSPEGLGWAGRQGYHIMTVGHPHPPDKVRAGVEAWREGLVATGRDPKDYHCQYHLRTYVDENAATAREIGQQTISRYEDISRIQRKAPPASGLRVPLGGDARNRAQPLWQSRSSASRSSTTPDATTTSTP